MKFIQPYILSALMVSVACGIFSCDTDIAETEELPPVDSTALTQPVYTSAKDTVVVKTKTEEFDFEQCKGNDCAKFSVSYPELVNLPDSSKKVLNKEVLKLLGAGDTVGVKQLSKNFMNDYAEFASDGVDKGWYHNDNINVVYNAGGVITLEHSSDEYTGGAHGTSGLYYHVYDVLTGKKLKLNDLFTDNYLPALNKKAEKAFRMEVGLKPGEELAAGGFTFPKNRFAVNENFAVTEEGLFFFFNAYEIGPYALGTSSFTIPWADLKDIIRPDGPLGSFLPNS